VVAVELRATDGLPTTPPVAKEMLDAVDIDDSPSVEVASLSSSLACEVVFTESSTPPPVACEVTDLQSDLVVPSAMPPPMVVDALAAAVGLLTPLRWPGSSRPLHRGVLQDEAA
jgi:hypothetical protein